MGYHRAGFEVVGVDIVPHRSYPFQLIVADALAFLGSADAADFDVIHASPPCHHYSTGTQHRKNAGVVYPDLLGPTQDALRADGRPYVIENVSGARTLLRSPVLLCGGMFGLGVTRHRFFESNVPLPLIAHTCNRAEVDADAVFNIRRWHEAMGIDWMPRGPLTQAIPPAYTEWIGRGIVDILQAAA
jgi:DNA (cytosine-5)-methyltransferase 1